MNQKWTLIPAAALLLGCLAGCSNPGSQAEQQSAASETEAPSIIVTVSPDAVTLPPDATPKVEYVQTDAEQSVTSAVPVQEAPATTLTGKWEIYTLDGQTLQRGQYGDEEYARLYQMEIVEDGTAAYYDRGNGTVAYGSWLCTDGTNVELAFGAESQQNYYPMNMNAGSWVFEGTTLTGQTDYLGPIVLHKVNTFSERAVPELAWVPGRWVGGGYDFSVYNVDSTVVFSMYYDGASAVYCGDIQQDGSLKLVFELGDTQNYHFENAVFRQTATGAELAFPGGEVVQLQRQ